MVSVRLAFPRAGCSFQPVCPAASPLLSPQGSASARLATAVALRGESVFKQEAGGLHQRHPRRHTHLRHVSRPARSPPHPALREAQHADSLPLLFFPFAPLQSEEDGGNQLLVRAQEAAFEARGSGAHQRDHAEGEPRGHISGSLHSRSGSAQTRVYVQVSDTTHTHRGTIHSIAALPSSRLCLWRYWHRSLNPRKLVEVKFSHLSRNMTLQRTMKLYRLPDVNTLFVKFSHQYSKA